MNFQNAFNHLLGVEGKFVNNSLDRGGPTNYGITQKVYEKFLGRNVSLDEMRKMPVDHARSIYKKEYWDRIGGDLLKNYKIAYLLFDQAVNRGVGTAIIQAQRQLGILADGGMGPNTLRALNMADEKSFINAYLAGAEAHYRKIASTDPSQNAFLKGWLNRISGMRKYLDTGTIVAISGGFFLISAVVVFFLIQGSGSRKARRAIS